MSYSEEIDKLLEENETKPPEQQAKGEPLSRQPEPATPAPEPVPLAPPSAPDLADEEFFVSAPELDSGDVISFETGPITPPAADPKPEPKSDLPPKVREPEPVAEAPVKMATAPAEEKEIPSIKDLAVGTTAAAASGAKAVNRKRKPSEKRQKRNPLPQARAKQKDAPPQPEQTEPAPAKAERPLPEKQKALVAEESPEVTKPTIEEKKPAPAKIEVTEEQKTTFASDHGLEKFADKELLLDTKGLVKIYSGRTVVNGVDINVRPGEIVGLLGPNGAGKTTSFYMIVGLVPPNGGNVYFEGHDVTKKPMYVRARLGMGYLPQEESIFRKLTVEENIMAVMETLKIPRKERKERCEELLERFSITHIRKNVALTCSGGEKRRLTIARSLVTRPSLLMLDEPFSGVDPIAVNEIQSIVQDLRESGLAILITDHNARQTLELVDRAYLIYEGKVLREGSRDFLINDPVSRELYLGDRFTM